MNSILALVLIGILFLVTSGGSFLPGSGYSRNSYSQDYYGAYNDYGGYSQEQFYKRAGHADGKLLSFFYQYQIQDCLTGKSFSEALIIRSSNNPQYNK